MKKIMSVVAAMLMCLNFTACGSIEDTSSRRESSITNTSEQDIQNKQDSDSSEKTVELTQDNWQDYFEFKHYVSLDQTNAFDELDSILMRFGISLKADIADKITNMEDVAVEYSSAGGYYSWYEYNLDTKELTLKDAVSEEEANELGEAYEESGSVEIYLSDFSEGIRDLTPSIQTFSLSVNGNSATFIGLAYQEVNVTKIKGTITISE